MQHSSRRSRPYRLVGALAASLFLAGTARADVDMSGTWQVDLLGVSGPVQFVQNGANLETSLFGFKGTIDPLTGQFSLTSLPTPSVMACGIINATVAGDGAHFSGTLQAANLVCSGVPHQPMCACGAFTSSPITGVRCPTCGVCGNGVVEDGEQCDDGNTLSGDCCASSCHFEGPTASCTSDGNACTDDACDGAGRCSHLDNTRACGTPCAPAVCAGGLCLPQPVVQAGTPCAADAEPCTVDACDGSGRCGHGPHPDCLVAARGGTIALRSAAPQGGRLRWIWRDDGGRTTLADFGRPTEQSAGRVCLFAGPNLLFSGSAPPGATPRTRWLATARGFSFRSSTRAASGLTALQLLTDGGRTTLAARGDGQSVHFAGSLAVSAVRAQLLVEDTSTRCWEATFDHPTVSRATEFSARDKPAQ